MAPRAFLVLSAILVLSFPLYGYQEVLHEDKPLRSAQDLSVLFHTAFESVCSELYFSVDESQPWFSSPLMNEKLIEAAWSSTFGGLFYSHSSYSMTSSTSSKLSSVSMIITYTYPRSSITSVVEETDRKAASMVAALVKPGMSDYDKELALHDSLVQTASYDFIAYSTGKYGPGTDTPHGVLLEGKGVCDSFSKAFLMLAAKAGLECLIIQGTANEGSHSWNLVRVDGSWYHLDVTYDDPVGPTKVLSHDYFNLPDDLISANHHWNRDSIPICISSESNWFEVEKLVVNDFDSLLVDLTAAFSNREQSISRRVRTFNPASFGAEISNVISTIQSKGKVRAISYTFDQEIGSLTLDVKYP